MPKPIKITAEMKAEAQAEFAQLLNTRLPEGEINYSRAFEYEDITATVRISTIAYNKIVALLNEFSNEVAWHGLVSQVSTTEFLIEDIIVYPQEVTGCTVNTDQEKYTVWLYDFPDEVFNSIRMQGHSHVNMGVTPSAVDTGY